ncbi:MAG: hypothetical protein OEP45_04470 [Acidobacteriota bacterium]|nr:hypothetical protein [Acidobacteriota bacterium]
MLTFGSRSVRSLALRLLGAGVALMHGQLLWRRLADGSLTEAGVAARWAASVLLIGGLVAGYRRHGWVFRGRRAAVLWTLVALLHAVSGVPGSAMVAEPAPWLVVPLVILAARSLAAVLVPRGALRPAGVWRRRPRPRRLAAPALLFGAPGSRAPPC